MGKIKSFLKSDSTFLRDAIALPFGWAIGIYKLFFQLDHRILSIILGSFFIITSILLTVDLVKEFIRVVKKINQ